MSGSQRGKLRKMKGNGRVQAKREGIVAVGVGATKMALKKNGLVPLCLHFCDQK